MCRCTILSLLTSALLASLSSPHTPSLQKKGFISPPLSSPDSSNSHPQHTFTTIRLPLLPLFPHPFPGLVLLLITVSHHLHNRSSSPSPIGVVASPAGACSARLSCSIVHRLSPPHPFVSDSTPLPLFTYLAYNHNH